MAQNEDAMIELKVIMIGTSAGVVLSPEVLARLQVKPGDLVYLTETSDGYRLTSHPPEFERQRTLAEEITEEDREILKALAK